jgi:hypothetical protein
LIIVMEEMMDPVTPENKKSIRSPD